MVSHRRILLLPAEIEQADLRRTSMSVSVNTCFFSLCVHFVSCTVATGLGPHKEKRYELTFMFKLQGHKSACTTCAGSSEILRWLTPFLGPNMDPKWGPELDHISFLLLGLCLGPVLGPDLDPKVVSHRRILLLPAEVVEADLRRTSMSVSVNTCFFSLCVPLCFLHIGRKQCVA